MSTMDWGTVMKEILTVGMVGGIWGHAQAPPSPSRTSPPQPFQTPLSGASPIQSRKSRVKGKGRANADSSRIKITRELFVEEIIDTTAQATWTVPRTPTAYCVDISAFETQLNVRGSKVKTFDAYIRSEDQESWSGLTGHTRGDATVWGFSPDQIVGIQARRCQLSCNGVHTCEFIDPVLFAGCVRYEPDFEQMQELWNHELDANEREAASADSIISRFYTRIVNSKCKVQYNGIPIMVPLAGGLSSYGKKFFIGCSKWVRHQRFQHIYWTIPTNINEDVLRFAMDNNGRLPNEPVTVNETRVLTVHPQIGLKNCSYSHIHDGQIKPAKIQQRACPTQMIIFIPVDSTSVKTALVILRNPHNHPAHPHAKPSAEDRIKLGKAVQLASLTGLTAHKLVNAPSTSVVYGGQRVDESSPAFISRRKVRAFLGEARKQEYLQGMGWEGVLYELNVRETKLLKVDRYIHTAMSKNGFRLAVTMHPQIAMFIHKILSLNINFTFTRAKGDMDEWEVAGLLDRAKQ
ncbi:hypothetical protein DFH07DRAFT_943933 [Mycena maculata]|uniref:Uncharacterized protein n=1 Tax=Mycena maculata TaxID=230809 RepID=A0AAD7IBL4_9AGAR|nr:hypothetical protein DFH07DRAFT_943933 [Mycena maculata]